MDRPVAARDARGLRYPHVAQLRGEAFRLDGGEDFNVDALPTPADEIADLTGQMLPEAATSPGRAI